MTVPSPLESETSTKEEKQDIIGSQRDGPTDQQEILRSVLSSSPLPSPSQMLRSLLQASVHRGSFGNVMKGFRTARELLQNEQEREIRLEGGDMERGEGGKIPQQNQPLVKKASSEKRSRKKQLETTDDKKATKPANKPAKKTAKKTATVSSHFSKINKNTLITKKPKTVPHVERATPIVCQEPPQPQPKRRKTLAGHFSPQGGEDRILTALEGTKNTRRRKKTEITVKAKSKGKQRRVNNRAKKDTEAAMELLSPRTAIRTVNQQQVIFGNLSQLANEEDRMCHTDHRGLQGSPCNQTRGMARFGIGEELYDQEFETLEEFLNDEFGSSVTDLVKKGMNAGGLWDVAARNDCIADHYYTNFSTILGPDIQILQEECGERNSRPEGVTRSGPTCSRGASDSLVKASKPWLRPLDSCESPPQCLMSSSCSERAPSPTDPIPVSRPSTPVQATMAKEYRYGKHPRKSRSKTKPTSCKRNMSSSSPQKSIEHDASLRSSPSDKGLRTKTPQDYIHRYISNAILAEYTAEHSEADIIKTWHYKILLYQPIILEDLTEWLNTIGFRNVGVSCGVSPLDVRDWADTRSVLSMSRTNQRGNIRPMK